MPQKLPLVSVFPARYPNLRKIILQHEMQNVLCVLAIRLGLAATPLRSDRSRIPNPQLDIQFRQQSLEPSRVPAGFHSHAHLLSSARKLTVEFFGRFSMLEPLLFPFPGFCIDKHNLLEARMVIAPYNSHIGSFLRALVG